MKRGPTLKSAIGAVVILILLLIAGWLETVHPYPGQLCNWSSDCSLNERCQRLSFRDRDSQRYTGICVPKR